MMETQRIIVKNANARVSKNQAYQVPRLNTTAGSTTWQSYISPPRAGPDCVTLPCYTFPRTSFPCRTSLPCRSFRKLRRGVIKQ